LVNSFSGAFRSCCHRLLLYDTFHHLRSCANTDSWDRLSLHPHGAHHFHILNGRSKTQIISSIRDGERREAVCTLSKSIDHIDLARLRSIAIVFIFQFVFLISVIDFVPKFPFLPSTRPFVTVTVNHSTVRRWSRT
jgi:hypothetical protein